MRYDYITEGGKTITQDTNVRDLEEANAHLGHYIAEQTKRDAEWARDWCKALAGKPELGYSLADLSRDYDEERDGDWTR